jgi:hypothetical protein
MNSRKYIIDSGDDKTYILYIMETKEYQKGSFIGLFLYYDEDKAISSPEKLWLKLRHRVLFENSIDAILEKVREYGYGRNENYTFTEVQEPIIQ